MHPEVSGQALVDIFLIQQFYKRGWSDAPLTRHFNLDKVLVIVRYKKVAHDLNRGLRMSHQIISKLLFYEK